jgi:branched-chain amino acid transport system substrate-binding protein
MVDPYWLSAYARSTSVWIHWRSSVTSAKSLMRCSSISFQRQADGVMGISVWLPTASFKDELFGSAGDYAKTFEEQHGSPPDYTSAGCSAAGQVLQAAVKKLGEPPSLSEEARGKLNALIAGTDLQTFYGPIK